MPTRLTIPMQAGFGVGQFEAGSTFKGLQGLRWAWQGTFGILLPSYDAAFQSFGQGSFTPLPPNFFGTSGKIALANIGQGLTATQHAPITEHVQRAFVTDGIAQSIERAALDILHEKKKTAVKTAPRVIIKVIKPNVKAQLRPVEKRAKAAEDRATIAEGQVKALKHRVAVLERKTAKPHTAVVPGLLPRVGGIEREVDRIKGRVDRLWKLTGAAALALLIAKVLEKMGASYIRCSRMKKWGKSVCGMDQSLLDSLLADALLVVGTISIVEFAKELLAIENVVVGGLEKLVREI